jgi:hypothetical protein
MVFGGVDFQPSEGTWKTVFYRGRNIHTLKLFAEGPIGMKDIRLCALPNKSIAVFTRPQGEIGGRGTIGYREISSLDQLNATSIADAVLLDKMFAKDEWGGANETHLLNDGTIGVLAHVARFDDDARQYCAATFTFDPETKRHSPLRIIATRDMFLDGPAKRPDLKDVVFSSGLMRHANGRATFPMPRRTGSKSRTRSFDRSRRASPTKWALHIGVKRSFATLWRDPVDILIGILDVTGFAVHAILRIDDELVFAILFNPLINPGRAIAC